MDPVISKIRGKQGMIRLKYSDRCKGCNKNCIRQILPSGDTIIVRPFEDYHWICRKCKNCGRKALITDRGCFIYVNVYGYHSPEHGGCVENSSEITRDEIDRQFFYVRGFHEKEQESIFD